MIKVSVTCANEDGNFDMDYYRNNLMLMEHEKLGDALLKSEVDEEIGGTPAACVAIGHIHFDSGYSFKAAFAPHAGEIVADIANLTDIEPSSQVGKVKV